MTHQTELFPSSSMSCDTTALTQRQGVGHRRYASWERRCDRCCDDLPPQLRFIFEFARYRDQAGRHIDRNSAALAEIDLVAPVGPAEIANDGWTRELAA